MNGKPGRPRKQERTLDHSEIEQLQQEIATRKAMMNIASEPGSMDYTPTSLPEFTIDKDKIENGIKHIEKVLHDNSPEKASRTKIPMLESRAKELESKFKPYLETWKELDIMRRDTPEFRKAVRKGSERSKVEGDLMEWKEIQKQLRPDDQDAPSLDRLRED